MRADVKTELESVLLRPVVVEGKRTTATGKCCAETQPPALVAATVALAAVQWVDASRQTKTNALGATATPPPPPPHSRLHSHSHSHSQPQYDTLVRNWGRLKFARVGGGGTTSGGTGTGDTSSDETIRHVVLPGVVDGVHVHFGEFTVVHSPGQAAGANAAGHAAPGTGTSLVSAACAPLPSPVQVKHRRRHTFSGPGYSVDCTEFYTGGAMFSDGRSSHAAFDQAAGLGRAMYSVEVEMHALGNVFPCANSRFRFPERVGFLLCEH